MRHLIEKLEDITEAASSSGMERRARQMLDQIETFERQIGGNLSEKILASADGGKEAMQDLKTACSKMSEVLEDWMRIQ